MERDKKSKSNSNNSGNNQTINIDLNLGKKLTEKITKIQEIKKEPIKEKTKDLALDKAVVRLKKLVQEFQSAIDRAENKKIKIPKKLSDIPNIYSKINDIDDVTLLNKELLRRIDEINDLKVKSTPLYTSGFNQTFPRATPQTTMSQQFAPPPMPMPVPTSTINVNTPVTGKPVRPNIPPSGLQTDCPGYTDVMEQTRKDLESTFVGIKNDDKGINDKIERTQNLIKKMAEEYQKYNINTKCEPTLIAWQNTKLLFVNYLNNLLELPKDDEAPPPYNEPEPENDNDNTPESAPIPQDETLGQADISPVTDIRFTPAELQRLTTQQLYTLKQEIQRGVVQGVPDTVIPLIHAELTRRFNAGPDRDSMTGTGSANMPINVINAYEELRLRGVLTEPFFQQYNLSLDEAPQNFDGKIYNFFKLTIDDEQLPYLFNGRGNFLTQASIDDMGSDLQTQPVPNKPEAPQDMESTLNHQLDPENRTQEEEIEIIKDKIKSKCGDATANQGNEGSFWLSASSPGGGTWIQLVNCNEEENQIMFMLANWFTSVIANNISFLPSRPSNNFPVIP